MRIYGPNGTTIGSPTGSARRTSSSGFSLPGDAAATAETRAPVAPRAAGNIDALLALQGIDDPLERRRRSVQRGKGALDVLDDLKLGLIIRQSRSLHGEQAARSRGQPQILFGRSRP